MCCSNIKALKFDGHNLLILSDVYKNLPLIKIRGMTVTLKKLQLLYVMVSAVDYCITFAVTVDKDKGYFQIKK